MSDENLYGYGSKYRADQDHAKEMKALEVQNDEYRKGMENMRRLAEADSKAGRWVVHIAIVGAFLAITEWAGWWYMHRWLEHIERMAGK